MQRGLLAHDIAATKSAPAARPGVTRFRERGACARAMHAHRTRPGPVALLVQMYGIIVPACVDAPHANRIFRCRSAPSWIPIWPRSSRMATKAVAYVIECRAWPRSVRHRRWQSPHRSLPPPIRADRRRQRRRSTDPMSSNCAAGAGCCRHHRGDHHTVQSDHPSAPPITEHPQSSSAMSLSEGPCDTRCARSDTQNRTRSGRPRIPSGAGWMLGAGGASCSLDLTGCSRSSARPGIPACQYGGIVTRARTRLCGRAAFPY